ncbi:MAG: hypothetical protein ACT4QF_03770 [Sporichthyaceae bacterium]
MRREVLRLVGAAAGFGVVAGAVLLAAPTSSRAAAGVFLWTNGGGLVTPVVAGANEKCIDTFGAVKAQNFTDSDAVLSKDGLCSDFLVAVGPGESYEGPYGSVGFTPPGATDE